jgi:hypothetical protein
MTRPVRAITDGSCPAARRDAQTSWVRRSCQTMAGATGWPLLRSHSTVVSRWLVMPTASMSGSPAMFRAADSAASVDRQ